MVAAREGEQGLFVAGVLGEVEGVVVPWKYSKFPHSLQTLKIIMHCVVRCSKLTIQLAKGEI